MTTRCSRAPTASNVCGSDRSRCCRTRRRCDRTRRARGARTRFTNSSRPTHGAFRSNGPGATPDRRTGMMVAYAGPGRDHQRRIELRQDDARAQAAVVTRNAVALAGHRRVHLDAAVGDDRSARRHHGARRCDHARRCVSSPVRRVSAKPLPRSRAPASMCSLTKCCSTRPPIGSSGVMHCAIWTCAGSACAARPRSRPREELERGDRPPGGAREQALTVHDGMRLRRGSRHRSARRGRGVRGDRRCAAATMGARVHADLAVTRRCFRRDRPGPRRANSTPRRGNARHGV